MPFGLRNASGTFKGALNITLSIFKWQYALVYLKNVIAYSKCRREHLDQIRTLLTLLKEAGSSLELKKCQVIWDAADYLGHVVRLGMLEMAAKNLQALGKLRSPKDQTALQSFLGVCNI